MISAAAFLNEKAFEVSIEGHLTRLYKLKNAKGMDVSITNYGGRIVSLHVPDLCGHLTDVVVGFNSLDDYIRSSEPYYGCIIGRYGNRIKKGKFILDGKSYSLFINNGQNTLHGGKKGFQSVVWSANQLNDSTLELQYLSKDGEENFPGNLDVRVIYSVSHNNELILDYEAKTDKKTIINLTNHTFFNLNGEGSGTINNHLLKIEAHNFTPIDSTSIPLGSIKSVSGTPFDFKKPIAIGRRLKENNEQLRNGNGYDHNFVLDGSGLKHAATITGDKSGIVMDVLTDEPGLQFYGGNFMQGKNVFKSGVRDKVQTAFCLETQHFPDSPNHPSFPSTVLSPGELYKTKSIYRFSTIPK